ncbi:hypothetical protein Tco_0583909, partial [Tanacetum coccineum]
MTPSKEKSTNRESEVSQLRVEGDHHEEKVNQKRKIHNFTPELRIAPSKQKSTNRESEGDDKSYETDEYPLMKKVILSCQCLMASISELNLTVGQSKWVLSKITHVGFEKGESSGDWSVGLYLFDSDCPNVINNNLGVKGQRPLRGQRAAPLVTVEKIVVKAMAKKDAFLVNYVEGGLCVDNTDAGIVGRCNSGSNKDKGKVGE